MTGNDQPKTSRHRPTPSLSMWVVAFGVFIAADDLMVVATMLRPMIDEVGMTLPRDLDASAWIVNAYLIAYVAAIPLAGRLSDVVGRRSVFVGGLACFVVGSLVVPSTNSFPILLIGRAISAIGGGALVPVALAVAGDLYIGASRKRAFGILSAVETLGWVWGPLYGAVLVRFLSWEWQFYLNVPLAVLAMILAWRVLEPEARSGSKIDWLGATTLTLGLTALTVALLSQAKIQSVTGLEELTGGPSTPIAGVWLYPVAAVLLGSFLLIERHRSAGGSTEPIVNIRFLRDPRPATALAVNALVGVGLVIALVNVPLFVNIVESRSGSGLGQAALRAGWLLTALTAAMAATSLLGGFLAARLGNAVPTRAGLVLATIGLLLMARTWSAETPNITMAAQLGLVGAGIGLLLAPTTDAVVQTGEESDRGTAASLVIVFRLIGFCVGLAALTAWGLHRFNQLRDQVVLPALGTPGYQAALADASVEITTTALSETFLGAGLATGFALLLTLLSRPPRQHPHGDNH